MNSQTVDSQVTDSAVDVDPDRVQFEAAQEPLAQLTSDQLQIQLSASELFFGLVALHCERYGASPMELTLEFF